MNPLSARILATLLISSSLLLPAPASAAVDFEKQIWPILEAKCVECHQAPFEDEGRVKKPKVDLRFDAAWAILKGSENGPVLTPGDAAKSYMHEVTTLPEDDDMVMPPKGDPLTQTEQDLLKTWINEGADFGAWVGNLEGKPADPEPATPKELAAREHELFYASLAKNVEPASDAALEAAKASGAQLFPLQADSPLLRVDFLTGVSACTDDKLAALLPLKNQVAQLDLARTAITDAALKTISQLPNLASLDLRQTALTDAALGALGGLTHLRSLNLYGTQVTDAGIQQLKSLKNLRHLYLWGTQVTPKGAKQLASALPQADVSL